MALDVRIREVDVELAFFWISTNYAWVVDVREENEYAQGFIQKAMLHPYSTFEPSFLPYVDPILGVPKRILFFCLHGNIAPLAAAAWGEEMGSSIAFVIKGGFDCWLGEGLPVVQKPHIVPNSFLENSY